jgi:ABC-type Mn2+/Zn2+ transport system ATPase subunit
MLQHTQNTDNGQPVLTLKTGVTAVIGGEGSGKTHVLHQLAAAYQGQVFACDLKLPHQDNDTAQACWDAWRASHPHFDDALLQELIDALSLREHTHKQLFMLSTGSRRKVAIAGALASGATVTLLDQPFVSLDAVSIQAVLDFLQDMSTHPTRAWVVADYTAPAGVDLVSCIELDAEPKR